jgi:hypothetical protein
MGPFDRFNRSKNARVSENKIFGVHLPMKIGVIIFDPYTVFIVSFRMRKAAIRNIGVPS